MTDVDGPLVGALDALGIPGSEALGDGGTTVLGEGDAVGDGEAELVGDAVALGEAGGGGALGGLSG